MRFATGLALLASILLGANPESDRREARRLLDESTRRNRVLFTFDDGPHPDVTPLVLDVLAERRVRAVFFACGIHLEGRRGREGKVLLRRAVRAGHVVGTHTSTHPRLSDLDERAIAEEIVGAANLVAEATGRRPTLFRPPFGDLPPFAQLVLEKQSIGLLLWTTNVRDYRMDDPAEIASAVLHDLDARGGGVVLLHDSHPPTAEALPLVLDGVSPLNERRVADGLPPLEVVDPDELLEPPP